jgi:hypothetical protein
MQPATAQQGTKGRKTRPEKKPFTRVRFVAAQLDSTPDARARVRVVLAEGRKRFEAQVDGVGGETVVLRLAVEATIEALHSATDSAGRLQLVGIKLVNAFDGRVVLVCLNSSLWPEAKLLGAVPVREGLEEAAARAVLAATNRLVEKPDHDFGANGTNGEAPSKI